MKTGKTVLGRAMEKCGRRMQLRGNGLLREERFAYEKMETAELLTVLQRVSSELQRRMPRLAGYGTAARGDGRQGVAEREKGAAGTAVRMCVSRDYRIMLPERGGMEIELRPLPKMLFIFFLRHPEGVRFSELNSHKRELMEIYEGISHRLDREGMERSIETIVSPESNSFNSQRTKLSRELSRYFSGDELKALSITSHPGGIRTIGADRSLVSWED